MKKTLAIVALAVAVGFGSGSFALAQNTGNSGTPTNAATDTNTAANNEGTSPTKASTALNQDIAQFFNTASKMNQEEQSMAQMAHNKAGDNHAFAALAQTINWDHEANQNALKALAKKENIKLNNNNNNNATHKRLSNMNGAEFESAYLNAQIKDHQQALDEFKQAKTKFAGNHAVESYINQTIPVLEAHLHMSQAMQNSMNSQKTALNAQ
jgi:putative membrane protein